MTTRVQANVPTPPCHPTLFISPNYSLSLVLATSPSFCSERCRLQTQGLCTGCIFSLEGSSSQFPHPLGILLIAPGLPGSGQSEEGLQGNSTRAKGDLCRGGLTVYVSQNREPHGPGCDHRYVVSLAMTGLGHHTG